MSKPPSKLWILGPPVMIVLTAFAYYARHGSVRQWVDTRYPWVAEKVGRHLPQVVFDQRAPATPAPPSLPPPAAPEPEPPAPLPVAPAFLRPDGTVDLPVLAADREAWPKKIALKKAMEFPAVVAGKVVGKVRVPAGTETNLVKIEQGKLGLEYQGGGAWTAVEDTDLPQRLPR